jgi:hypothetical protein
MLDQEKRERLVRAGWRCRATGKCKVRGCTAIVEYWQNAHKQITIRDYVGLGPHWVSCEGTRKGKRKKQASESQLDLFQGGNDGATPTLGRGKTPGTQESPGKSENSETVPRVASQANRKT